MKTIIIISLLFAACFARADEKRPVDQKPLDASFLRLYAETRGFMLGRPVKPKPTPDGKAVLFLRSEPKKAKLSLFEFDVASGKTRELLTPEALLKGAEENLTAEEKARRERQRISVGGFTDYQLNDDGKQILVGLSGKLYIFDRATCKARELATGKGTLLDPKLSNNGSSPTRPSPIKSRCRSIIRGRARRTCACGWGLFPSRAGRRYGWSGIARNTNISRPSDGINLVRRF
ncbi:MAG: hypothetical protein K8T89_02825 [Planctomycetes bacterium]|nr:hypothetical protein [Planctomycetota bacterium]